MSEFAPIYAAMGDAGWSPLETDAMLPWQVAAFLGQGDQTTGPVLRGARSVIPAEPEADTGTVAEQIETEARDGRPKPKAPAPSMDPRE